MARYRKKPVEIEAVQFHTVSTSVNPALAVFFTEPAQWLEDAAQIVTFEPGSDGNWHCYIRTLEGTMEAASQDWIIRGIQGELYPCKPDVFEQTYEVVSS